MKRTIYLALILTVVTGFSLFAQAGLNNPDNPFALELNYESGAVKVLKNTIQIGTDGTNFDFVTQGGMIQFFKHRRRIRFYIAPDTLKESGLQVSGNLLRIAKVVRRR